MAKCYFEKPYAEVFTSLETYKNVGLELAITTAITTLSATLL